MSLTKSVAVAAFVGSVTIAGGAGAQNLPDTSFLEQYQAYSHQNNIALCNSGISMACHLAQQYPQMQHALSQLKQGCMQGYPRACQHLHTLNAQAMQAYRNEQQQARMPVARGNTGPSAGQILSEANDITHGTNMGLMNSGSNSGMVDMIHGRQVVTTPNGNGYRVDGYDNNVWINEGQGTYIGTDNPNFNPNQGGNLPNWLRGN